MERVSPGRDREGRWGTRPVSCRTELVFGPGDLFLVPETGHYLFGRRRSARRVSPCRSCTRRSANFGCGGGWPPPPVVGFFSNFRHPAGRKIFSERRGWAPRENTDSRHQGDAARIFWRQNRLQNCRPRPQSLACLARGSWVHEWSHEAGKGVVHTRSGGRGRRLDLPGG